MTYIIQYALDCMPNAESHQRSTYQQAIQKAMDLVAQAQHTQKNIYVCIDCSQKETK